MFSQKASPPTINGCSLVTSTMSSVLGRSSSCQVAWAACGHAVYRPLSVSVLTLVDPVEKAHDAVE